MHQEDVCQALAVDIGLRGAGKYQGEGGPGFADVANLLDVHNGDPGQTGLLLEVATFTVAIGNSDAHGKNLSMLDRVRGQSAAPSARVAGWGLNRPSGCGRPAPLPSAHPQGRRHQIGEDARAV